MRRCRYCEKPLPTGGNLFFCDKVCAGQYGRSPKSDGLAHSEVFKLMKDIEAVDIDKIVLDRCARCERNCKIFSTAPADHLTVYCEAAGLRDAARELGLARVEFQIGFSPVELEI